MVAAVAPFIDTAISKTVNVPADYPYADFQGLYLAGLAAGPEGPGHLPAQRVLGAVLSVDSATRPRRRSSWRATAASTSACALERLPAPVLASLRWPGRPELPGGNPAWTYMIQHPHGEFALFVGELPAEAGPSRAVRAQRCRSRCGSTAPSSRAASARWPRRCRWTCAPTTPAWLKLKLDALATVAEERAFEMPMPPHGEPRLFPGVVAATAAVIRWRCEQLGCAARGRRHAGDRRDVQPRGAAHRPVGHAGVGGGREQPGQRRVVHRHPEGGAAARPARAGFVTRPCAIGFSGNYPRALDGLARLLSLDMRVIDPAWIGMKLRKLLNYAEPLGPLHGAGAAASGASRLWPSTVAYIARLVIHRYAMLGVLDEQRLPAQ